MTNTNESNNAQKAVLLRCNYPYGKSQLWMPSDLYKVAEKLEGAGIQTDVADLNLERLPANLRDYNYTGIGVIGAPYIPDTIKLAEEVREKTGKNPLIGGPGVEYLSEDQFRKLYGSAIQIRNDKDLSTAVDKQVPSVYEVSIKDRINSLNPQLLEKYLGGEFSFFVSQGCKYSCNFCSAVRSRPGARVTEQFSRVVRNDLEALAEKAKEFKIDKLSMYLTPLDLFQNPTQFKEVLRTFAEVRQKSGLDFSLRGLSRVDSFLKALKKEPELYQLIPSAKLQVVGFGVDGTTEEIWRSQHKGNVSLSQADEAFTKCNDLGITPEALMVMGFHDSNGIPVDTKESLQKNVDYSISRGDKYGVVSRPHVAKDLVPGNNGWENPVWAKQRDQLLANPRLFKNLDFVSLASELTHPDPEFRNQVNDAYLEIVNQMTPKGLCVSTPLLPYNGNPQQDKIADAFNMLAPWDK